MVRDKAHFPAVATALILTAAAAAWKAGRDTQVSSTTTPDPGRGRSATSPIQIPWLGWKDIFLRTYEEISKDRLLAVAAGVVFYGLLAIFPAMTALVSLYGLFADVGTISNHLSVLADIVPRDVLALIENEIRRISSSGQRSLGLASITGLLLAIWSANAGMKAMFDALNVIYGEEEKRGFVRLNLISLSFTLGSLIFLLLAIASVVVVPVVLSELHLGGFATTIVNLIRWPLLFALIVFGLALLYRFGPSRRDATWRWISPGSVAAAILWVIGSSLFSWYLSNFANYNATYGSLGAAIGMMMWFWLTSIVVLTGAELNAEIEHQTARDSTRGDSKPLGARGATMADTIGAPRASSL